MEKQNSSNWWNKELEGFVLQNAEALMRDHGFLNKFARVSTDIGGISERLKSELGFW